MACGPKNYLGKKFAALCDFLRFLPSKCDFSSRRLEEGEGGCQHPVVVTLYNSVLYSLLFIFFSSPFKKRIQRACEGNAEAEDKPTISK
jgi:hypothetical protein